MKKPLADLLRPTSIDEVVGQKHLLGKGMVFRNAVESGKITNMIFYGPPGVGKTTLANIIAKNANMSLYKLNGTSASTDDIKKIIGDVGSVFSQNGILLYLLSLGLGGTSLGLSHLLLRTHLFPVMPEMHTMHKYRCHTQQQQNDAG